MQAIKPMLLLCAMSFLVTSAPCASAQETFGRMVATNNVRVTSSVERITTGLATKQFFVPYGGALKVQHEFRSNGAHTVDTEVFVNSDLKCGSSTTFATYSTATCTIGSVPAGSTITVRLRANGQEGALRNARLLFNVVSFTQRAVVLKN